MKTLGHGMHVIDDAAALHADLDSMEPWPASQVIAGFETHENSEIHVGDLALGIYASRPGQLMIDPAYPVDEVIKILSGELLLREASGISFKRFGAGEWLYVGRGYEGIWELRGDFRELHILPGEDAPEGLGEGLPELAGQTPDQVGLSAVTSLDPSRLPSGSSAVLSGRKLVVKQLQLGPEEQLRPVQKERILAIQEGQVEVNGTTLGPSNTLVLTERFEGSVTSVTNTILLEITHAGLPQIERPGQTRTRILVSSVSDGRGLNASNWGNSMSLAR